MRFAATIRQSGKTATGIPVPDEVVDGLGPSRRPPVRVTIGDHTYRSTIARLGDEFMLPVSAEVRRRAGVEAGDRVEVELVLDTEPRMVTVPADFAAALDAEPRLRQVFDKLAYSHQLRHVLAIEAAKAAPTRQRRIAKAIDMLRAGRT